MDTPSTASMTSLPSSPSGPPPPPAPYTAAIFFICMLVPVGLILFGVLKLVEWHRRTRFREMWAEGEEDEADTVDETDLEIDDIS